MKSRSFSEVAGGGRQSEGTTRISTYQSMSSNHESPSLVASDRTGVEGLREAYAVAARQLMVLIPPSERVDETQQLKDAYRTERRVLVDEDALSWMMQIQAKRPETRHVLSDALRAIELRYAGDAPCLIEALDAEQDHDALFDKVKLPAYRTQSPSRVQQTKDATLALIRRLWVVVHACDALLQGRAA